MSSVLDDVVDEVEPAPNIVSVMAGTKPSLLLSIDVGTSGVRAALFDERGNEVPGAQARSHRNLPRRFQTSPNSMLMLSSMKL